MGKGRRKRPRPKGERTDSPSPVTARSRHRSFGNYLLAPVLWAERQASRLYAVLSRSAIVKLLGLTVVSALGALAVWLWNAPDRRREKEYRLWEVIQGAEASGAEGGRKAALEELAAGGASLARVNLAGAWIPGVRLRAAELMYARLDSALLESAILDSASLRNASLRWVNLALAKLRGTVLDSVTATHARFYGAELQHASARRADFRRAYLHRALLDSADFYLSQLDSADLAEADLFGAQFSATSLRAARLDGAQLGRVRLAGADLRGASLSGVKNWRDIRCLDGANIFGVRDAPAGFERWALAERRAVAIPSDSAWNEAKRRLLSETAFGKPEGPLVVPVPDQLGRQFRVPVVVVSDGRFYNWFSFEPGGSLNPLTMSIAGHIIADCLPPYRP